jgi:lipopolysaccharide/colanic/teichoic acid biosynthesis glycosyltransferase
MHDDGVLIVDEPSPPAHVALLLAAPAPTPVQLPAPRHGPGWIGKRAIDIVLSVTLLLLTAPLFLVLAVVIKLTSSGTVFFRQRRVGRAGVDFSILKFRTMQADSEQRLRSDPALHEVFLEGGHKIPSRLDPRVTGVGRVMRRLSLDELPQLLNVLAGHMSMVGPRPVERSQLLRDYGEHQAAYVALRPGLTGLWQVSGRSTVRFPERAELDSHYQRMCGPWMDTKIILRTPRALITGLGAD